MDRILASHFETEQGADYSTTCGSATDCQGELRGRLQPYAIYVPTKPAPARGYGLTLLLHSLGANYNQFADTRNQSQLGERGPGSIVITPEGRGPGRLVLRTRRRRHLRGLGRRRPPLPARSRLDGDLRLLDGRLRHLQVRDPVPGPVRPRATRSSARPGSGIWVPPAPPQPGGAASNTNRMLASVRNIPFLIWDGTEDELVPGAGRRRPRRRPSTTSATATPSTCSRPPTTSRSRSTTSTRRRRSFLGTHEVDRNPAHVTYVVNPTMDFAASGHGRRPRLLAVGPEAPRLQRECSAGQGRRALGGLRTRRPGGEARPRPQRRVAPGRQPGRHAVRGAIEELGRRAADDRRGTSSISTSRTSLRSPSRPRGRASSCHSKLDVTTDGPLTVTLAGCGRTLHFGGP